MPRLSDTMTEGVIAAWHKKVGDSVKKGDLLAEVETDKATMELESYKDGTLLHIGSDKGGKTAAVLRTFITSCELVNVDPFAWFRDVLSRIADHPITRLDELMPHNWAPAKN